VPVTINGVLVRPEVKKLPGRPSYNDAIKKLMPAIKEARANGHHAVRAMVNHLNAKDVKAPSGRPFTYGTLHLILVRLEELRLADGTRSISEAASQRRYSYRRGRNKGWAREVLAHLLRQHPEALKGLPMPGSKPPE
jgi:hypothetical protein